MKPYLHVIVSCLALLACSGAAQACRIALAGEANAAPVTFAALAEGITAARFDCNGQKDLPVLIWTLAIDHRQPHVGVRDNRLFDEAVDGPMRPLVSARIESHARIHVMERQTVSGAARTAPPGRANRRFVTFCDAGHEGDPLDCSLAGARLKARVTPVHRDRDGVPDLARHEISHYDGAARLSVLIFDAPYAERPEADIGRWIGMLNALSGALAPDETTGSID
ncbi:hypothetical protein ACLB6G_02740 [Zhengella sp. ZM62]|uniref:hypothetical protein n=1 Tax=Zhengella sedimenti TaxID=3390035 RepID=UPI0039758C8F